MEAMSHAKITEAAEKRREDHREQETGRFGDHDRSTPEGGLPGTAWPEDLGKTHFAGQWGEVSVGYGANTPWGPAQHASREADGIVFVPTDGHGGYKLSPERNAAIPAPFRNRSGWYEEDGDRVFVELYHYDALFNRPQDDPADRSERLAAFDQKIRDYYPDQYEKAHRVTLAPGESTWKDRRVWGEDNADEYVMTAQERIEDGLILVHATRQSTGDKDRFVLTPAQRDAALEDAAAELGADGRFRVPEGATPQPRPEPAPIIPGYTSVPSIDGLTAAAAKKVQADLAQRWRLSATGESLSLRQLIERGDITEKRVYIGANGTREFYLNNGNTSSALKVSKATWDAFEAPDTRSAADHAEEMFRIAEAKFDKAQHAFDGAWRPTPLQHDTLREARKAKDAAYEAWKAVRS